MCQDNTCNCDNHSNSSFILGILLGAIIAAIIAVVIYKNNQSQVITNLKTKLQKYFDKLFKSPTPVFNHRLGKKKSKSTTKIPVILPKKVIESSTPKTVISRPGKMFLKPKTSG